MRRTLHTCWQIMLAVVVALGAGCGSITVVDNGAQTVVSDDPDGGGQPVVAACSATSKCDDGEVCNLDNGTCVECLRDGDCSRGKHSRCDTAHFVCVECFADDDCDHGNVCCKK